MKRLLQAVAVLAVAGALALTYQVNSFMNTPLDVADNGTSFEIPAGASFISISAKLIERELIDSDRWLRIYVRWHGLAGAIQAGDYLIESGATPESLLHQFTSGAVHLYAFTLIEGWSYREVLQALHANEAVKVTMTDEDWPALLDSLGAEVTHPEGLFLPETYLFPRNTTDRELLRQAYALMESVLAEEWARRQEALQVHVTL